MNFENNIRSDPNEKKKSDVWYAREGEIQDSWPRYDECLQTRINDLKMKKSVFVIINHLVITYVSKRIFLSATSFPVSLSLAL